MPTLAYYSRGRASFVVYVAAAKRVQLGHHVFETKKSAQEHFKAILNTPQRLPHRLAPTEAADLLSLLQYHPRAADKIGSGVLAFDVDMAPRIPGANVPTRCFWVVRVDGSRTDFSYIKCLDHAGKAAARAPVASSRAPAAASRAAPLPVPVPELAVAAPVGAAGAVPLASRAAVQAPREEEKKKVESQEPARATAKRKVKPRAATSTQQDVFVSGPDVKLSNDLIKLLRRVIQPQVDEFRRSTFRAGPVSCAVSGVALTPATCHVDHEAPATFLHLATTFVRSLPEHDRQLLLQLVHADGSAPSFMQPETEAAWAAFHQRHARLRLVTPKVNLAWRRGVQREE